MAAPLAVTPSTDVPEQVDRPLLTYYDDATGERTALTASQLGGWAARTAGLLRDGCGLGRAAGSRCCCRRTGVPLRCCSGPGRWGWRCRSGRAPPPGCRSSNRAATDRATRCSSPRSAWTTGWRTCPTGCTATWSAPPPGAGRRAGGLARLVRRGAPARDAPPDYAAAPPVAPRPPPTARATPSGARSPRRSPRNSTCAPATGCWSTRAEHEQPVKWLLAPLVSRRVRGDLRQPGPRRVGRSDRRRADHPGALSTTPRRGVP